MTPLGISLKIWKKLYVIRRISLSLLRQRLHKPLRLDISDKSGDLLVYVRSYLLPRQLTKFETPSYIQAIPFEVNMRKKKWFFLCIYKPPSMKSQYFLDSLSDIIDCYSNVYNNHILIGDFNLEPSQMYLETFINSQLF